MFELAQGEKDRVVRAYVKGFQTLFQVYIGLVGLNLCVALVLSRLWVGLMGCSVIAVLFIRRHSLRREDEKVLKEKGKAWIEQRGEKKKGADVEKGRGSQAFGESEKGTTAKNER